LSIESLESNIDEGHMDPKNLEGLKHRHYELYLYTYKNVLWVVRRGWARKRWRRIPSFMMLIEILEKINLYTTILDAKERLLQGPN
jgi:hypothetical protein